MMPATQTVTVAAADGGCNVGVANVTVGTLAEGVTPLAVHLLATVADGNRRLASRALVVKWTRDPLVWARANVACKPYILVPLRGSGTGWTATKPSQVELEYGSYRLGDAQNDRELYGTMRSLFEALRKVDALADLGFVVPPGYRAPPVSYDEAFLAAMYQQGPSAVLETMTAVARVCPRSQFILAGFSQGAYVAHRVAATAPPKLASKVVAAVAVGDPARGVGEAVAIGLPEVPGTVGLVAATSQIRALAERMRLALPRCLAVSSRCNAPTLNLFLSWALTPTSTAGPFTTPPERAGRIASIYVPNDWVADSVGDTAGRGVFTDALRRCSAEADQPTESGWSGCEQAFNTALTRGNAAHSSYGSTTWLLRAVDFIVQRL